MPRKAIIHIGPMKTGSSSIQSWLNRSRESLLDAGFFMPAGIGTPNMSRMSYMAQVLAAGEELTPVDARRLAALRDELAALPDSVHTVIFSGEMLSHQLKRENELQAFQSMLGEFFDDYMILLYLRRQDELSLSRYSTALRQGLKPTRPLSVALDYEAILNRWSEHFGCDAVRPRLFDRKVMPDGDVVRDFAEAIGLPMVDVGDDPIARNASIRPEAQAFLADLAKRVKEAGFADVFSELPGHTIVNRRLSQEFKGRGTKPSRADAMAFFEEVRESNERVRAAWFPDRPTLFSEDFSEYTDEGTPEPTPEQLLEVAMSVLVALVIQTPPTEAEAAAAPNRGARRRSREKREMRNRKRRFRKARRSGQDEGGAESNL